jgi:hypothetical protein
MLILNAAALAAAIKGCFSKRCVFLAGKQNYGGQTFTTGRGTGDSRTFPLSLRWTFLERSMMDEIGVFQPLVAIVAIFVIAQLFPKGAKVLKNGEAHSHGPEWTSAAAYAAQSAPYAVSDR